MTRSLPATDLWEGDQHMGNMVRLTLLILVIALAGCAKSTLVALVPDLDGNTGSISVTNGAGSVAIDTAYQATTIADVTKRPAAPVQLGKQALDQMFAQALSISPKPPLHFLLYFDKETTLTSDSLKLLPEITAAIRERNSGYISVFGHADTLGSEDYNLALSNRRALTVKETLVQQGVAPDTIQTTSHGKGNPLIPTADNVYEPKNRRVEVVVR
jgi:outer membrane protein OmpA-like peptidoglycan-associated protein